MMPPWACCGLPSKEPKARLLCFPNAGNEENLYTNEGVGARKVDTLLAHCRANGFAVAPHLITEIDGLEQ